MNKELKEWSDHWSFDIEEAVKQMWLHYFFYETYQIHGNGD